MNAKVGFNEVQNYAKLHNVDFKTAAQKLGLSAQEAADLERLGGDPGAPEDGFKRAPVRSFTLKSGRKVNVYKDASGKQTFEYLAADGTKLKEAYFLKQEGLTGSHFAVNNNGQLVTVKNQQQPAKKEEDTPWYEKVGNFVKDNAGALIAGTAVVAGAICCATGVGTSVGVPLLIIGGAVGLTSCSPEDPTEFNTNIQVNITIPPDDQSELIAAFKEGIDALLAKMDELGYKVDQYGDQIIKLLTDNNVYLKNISNSLKEQGLKQDEIIEILTNINTTVQTIESLVAATNENITINGENISNKLNEILNAIKTGQANSMEALDGYMEQLRQLLLDVIANQKEEIHINEENGMTLDQIYETLLNMDGMTGDKLTQMLEILQSIESIGKDINNKLDEIIGKFDEVFNNNTEIKAALEKIEEYLKTHNDQTDVTNNLLEQLLKQYNNGGISQEDLQKLLDAIAANGDKIDATNQLLVNIQNQDAEFQKKVLDLLANVGTEYSDILNKILQATTNNGAALSDINQILAKIQNQDEKFQQKVLDLLNKAGDNSTEIISQLGMINQILAKIQGQDETFQNNVLNILNNMKPGEAADYTEILNKILEATLNNGNKLDGIGQLLAKIQNQDADFQKNVLNILNNMKPGEVADYTEILNQILEATKGNGTKLDALGQLLAKIQNQDAEFQKNILEAVNKLGVDIASQLNKVLTAINNISVSGGDTSNLEALLNKVLEKMDSNTAAIIDAIGNIKPGEGGNVDLSSLEKMLSELLQLTSKNNSLLESIDGKMDVIKLTIEAAKDEIIAHLGNGGGNVDVDAILEKLDEFMSLSNANSEAILKKMDTIINLINNIKTYDDSALMAKLDDILAAIKDHNITVDITGKVTCECNCGGNHEGILGDLEDVLG